MKKRTAAQRIADTEAHIKGAPARNTPVSPTEAIVPTTDATHKVELVIPVTKSMVMQLQATAEADALDVKAFKVTDVETYKAVDEALTDVVRREDALKMLRSSATGPFYREIKPVEAWFKPVFDALATCRVHLKNELSRWNVEQRQRETDAREAAAQAATARDSAALIEALTEADAAATPAGGRATVAFGWEVDRIVRDLLPDEYLVPDLARLEAVAKAHKGDQPPVIPGVVFKQVAKIGAKR